MATKKKLYTLTDAHRAQLKPWADKWIANAMNCEPMTAGDRLAMNAAVRGLYAAADLKAPRNVVFAPSPISAALAAGIAAGVWWLRKHPEIHRELFGGSIKEVQLMAAIGPACTLAVQAAQNKLRTLKSRAAPPAAPVAATVAATGAATYAATYAATDAATRAATITATYAATYAA